MPLLALLTSFLQWAIDLDTQLTLAINDMHTDCLNTFMYWFSDKCVWLPVYASLVALVFLNFSWRTALVIFAGIAVVILITDQVSANVLRHTIERMRPSNLDNPISHTVKIVNDYRGGRFGFPSAHAANTLALTVFLHRLLRNAWLTVAMTCWAVLTAYSRVYLGVHYLGDVTAGMLLGALVALAVYALLVRFAKLHRPQQVRYALLPVAVLDVTMLGLFAVALI
ncbi:MAG: phosphatase PAP2 family protein [Bacteroidaceae bacterium]|nr:phosphatase PAP2 family protein [Bacteroidaceae bacterium]